MQGEEFQTLLAAVRSFTLLSVDRLFSLYSLAKQICLDDVPGEIVECGTCRGGAAALLAAVVQRYSLRPRRVYAFDTFAGMPDPTEIDRHEGIPANETGFGAGTLKAPIAENLNLICETLGVQDLVIPVAGLFAETLPATRSRIGAIALLHADGDWYESTLDIFNTLYDQIVADGVIQVDDYGHWEGCRQAIHEFERDRFTEFGLRSIDYTGVWFTKRDAAHPDCNYWRICWHWAQSAVRQGDRLAESAMSAVLKLMPNLVQADRLRQLIDRPDLTESLRLRSINWIAFPDWNQPEDELFAMLSELLHSVLTHPDSAQLTLLISTSGVDPEEADLMISSVAIELVSELEIDDEPEITLFGDLSAIEWRVLLPQIAQRVRLPQENQSAIDQSGIDRA
ncbi:class I SAM-dependent methyltransferase [Microcoleus sp. FACHB-1515]|nr:class I SAM-dependent methyltransferase [Microcoleus sp. FACHB-1515]